MSNMYNFIDMTWNPLAGECHHRCSYCYVNKLKKRFPHINQKYSGELRLDQKEMDKNLGSGKTIFVCSCNDIFQYGYKKLALQILDKVNNDTKNTYIIQTKNPFNNVLEQLKFNSNIFFGTTIESNYCYEKIMGNCCNPIERFGGLKHFKAEKKFITIEPILDFNLDIFASMLIDCYPDQINIGADSGNNNLPEPSKEKVLELIEILKNQTTAKIVLKPNLNRIIK